jgi:DNA-binding transcriptional LysR family regulator
MPLFDRSLRPPVPNSMALRAYEHALPILRAVEDLVAMAQEKASPTGLLRLGMVQGVGDLVLAEAADP